MPRKFAKLFEIDDIGQVLVKIDDGADGDGPEVRFYFHPEGLGVCSMALQFTDSEKGWDEADKAFDLVDQDKARIVARDCIEKLAAFE